MANSSEDALGELYTWDSTIDEMYERGEDHADFDEDEALEAYEEMIQMGAAPADTYGDAVLSLAAQLLTKHFYKFPHVHMNVVDVLLGLCAPARAQAVRIHTVRSLLQIVKSATSSTPPLVKACRSRIADHIAALIDSEASAVVVRQLTQLQDTLSGVDAELSKAEKIEQWKEKKEQAKAKHNAARDDERPHRASNNDEEERRTKNEDREARRREEEEIRREEAAKRERREARFGVASAEQSDRSTMSDSKRRDDREFESPNGRDYKRRDSYRDDCDTNERASRQYQRATEPLRDEPTRERRPPVTKETGNGCPPSSFIFIGGVPRNTYPEDIINYLQCIDESVTYSCVQIKFPNQNPLAAGYAFVSLESVEHARKAIRHIQTTEFNGRTLIGDFARGPPCSTLQFVERNGSLGMHDQDAVIPVNVDTLEPSVWDELCALLKQYGSLDILRDGRIRFRDTESAKLVIRKHRIFIQGREFLPVYDPEEQSEIDSSRRRRRNGDDGDARRGDGANRYGGSDKTDRRGSRDDSDRKRRRSQSFDRDHNDKFSRRDHNDDRGERHHHHTTREFDQARYGPRDSPSTSTFKHRESFSESKVNPSRRERDVDGKADERGHDAQRERRNSAKSDFRRSASRSPVRPTEGKYASQRGRSRSRSPAKQSSHISKAGDYGRHRSPAKSSSSMKYDRGEKMEYGRGRRDDNNASGDGDRVGRENRERIESFQQSTERGAADRRHSQYENAERTRRSRSPTKRNEYSGDRRRDESSRRDHTDRVPHSHRGRSPSPRRAAPSEVPGNGVHDRGNYSRGEPKHDQDRSRAFSHDDKRTFDRYGNNHHRFNDNANHGPRREENPPPRFGDDGRDGNGRRGSSAQHMSKYGTIGGTERSPSPPPFGRDESSRGRDRNERFGHGDEKYPQRNKYHTEDGSHRYGNENHSRENRDRRASPTRHQFKDHGNHHFSVRGRSPTSKHTTSREGLDDAARRRSRSPSPFNVQKKPRSRSPAPPDDKGRHREHHGSRFGEGDRRRHDKFDRHFNRDSGRDNRGGYDGKHKDDRDRRTYDRQNVKGFSPRQHAKRNEETNPRSPSAQAHRSDRTRTPSPMIVDNNSTDVEPVKDAQHENGNGQPSSTYEDIDECMVDYEEDD